MPDASIKLYDFKKGLITRGVSPLAYPSDALLEAINVRLADGGVKCRPGMTETAEVMGTRSQITGGVWTLLAPTGTPPAARIRYGACLDTVNRDIIYFGGLTGDVTFSDEIWKYNIDDNTWTGPVTCTGTPPTARQYPHCFYDTDSHSVLVFGGGRYLSSWTYYSTVHKLDLATNVWSLLSVSGTPPLTDQQGMYRAAFWDDANRRIVVFGDTGGWWVPHYAKVFDLATLTWSALSEGTVALGDRAYWDAQMDIGGGVFDPVAHKFYIGTPAATDYAEGLRCFDVGTLTWSYLGAPSLNTYAIFKYDNYLFTLDTDTYPFTNNILAMFALDDNYSTSGLPCTGDIPDWVDPTGVYDSVTDKFYFFGDVSYDQYSITNKLYSLQINLQRAGYVRGLWQIRFPSSEASYLLAQTEDTNGGNKLQVAVDPLPNTDLTFEEIYNLGVGAGLCEVAVLGDRAIITEGKNHPPLVFSGGLTDDGSDWPAPKAVLIYPDGVHAYDITRQVCDSDPTNSADVANIQVQGHIDVILDQPEVEALAIEMDVVNTAQPIENQLTTTTVEFDDIAKLLRHDVKGGIIQWYKDATAKGHFEGAELAVDAGPVVNKGGGLIGIPCTGHGLVGGQKIRFLGTPPVTAYDGNYTLDASTSENELVFAHAYGAHTFTEGEATVHQRFTLGEGNEAPDVVPGMVVDFAGTEVTILTITDDGADASDVTLSSDHATANVTAVYGLVVDNDTLTVNSAAVAAMLTSFSKTLDGNPFIANYGLQLRQRIKGSDLAHSGSYVKVTLDCSAAGNTATQYNGTMILYGASIVEEDGDTGNGVTTPTALIFPYGAVFYAGTSLTSPLTAFTVDETKNYLIITDWLTYYQTMTRYGIPAVMLKAKDEGGGLWFKAGTFNAAMYLAGTIPRNATLQTMPDGFTDYSAYPITVGVSKIEVQTDRSAPTALHVACTNSTSRVPLYFLDQFIGVSVDETVSGSAKIWWDYSLDEHTTWQVFKAGEHRTYVRQSGGVWQYKDDLSAWQNASVNDMQVARREGQDIADNQMSGTEFTAITPEQWALSGGIVPKITQYLDIGMGLQIGGDVIPYVISVSVTWQDLSTTLIEGYAGGQFTPGYGWTDGTILNGLTLGQDGIISYDGGTMTLDYAVSSGVHGYVIRIKVNGTAPGTRITAIRYKAPTQPLSTIGVGIPDPPLGFIVVDDSTGTKLDATATVIDNLENDLSVVALPLETDDEIAIGGLSKFFAVELTPYVANENTAYIEVYYWNGIARTLLTVIDNTDAGAGKTLSTTGRIEWALPDDWKECIPYPSTSYEMGFWIWLKVSATLSTTTSVAEARIYSVPEARSKYRHAITVLNRLALGDRPDQRAQWDIGRTLEEFGFCGTDARADGASSSNQGGVIAGAGGNIAGAIEAWGSLFSFGADEMWQLLGSYPEQWYFGRVEAAGLIPINSRVVVKAPMSSNDGDRYALFLLNERGAFAISGMQADNTFGQSRVQELSENSNLWKQDHSGYRLDLDHLHLACGVPWHPQNQIIWSVPMILPGNTEQTTNNALLIWNRALNAWETIDIYPTGFACLCVAYQYSATAPGGIGPSLLLAGGYDGKIYRLLDGTDDDGTAIAWHGETGWLGFNRATEQVRDIVMYGSSTSKVDLSVYRDGDEAPIPVHGKAITGLTGLTGKEFTFQGRGMNVKTNFLKLGFAGTGPAQVCAEIGVNAEREVGT